MPRLALALIALLLAALPAWADWTLSDDGRVATVCPIEEDEARLCLSLGCDAEGPLGWALGHAGVPEFTAQAGAQAVLSVGARLVGTLDFAAVGPNRMEAPLTRAHLQELVALKLGARAEMKLRADPERLWASVPVSLRGSRVGIDGVEAACPLPDFDARARADRTVADPRAAVLAAAERACAELGGSVLPQPGLVQEIDLDGKGAADILVYHPAAACSAAPMLACGPDGCLRSLWVAQEDGQFRRVLERNLYGLTFPGPGAVMADMAGSACGRSNAQPCRRLFVLGDDLMQDQGEVTGQ